MSALFLKESLETNHSVVCEIPEVLTAAFGQYPVVLVMLYRRDSVTVESSDC